MFKVPHALISTANPVFRYQVRRAGRLAQLSRLKAFSRFMLVGAPVAMILIWGLLLYLTIKNTPPASYYYSSITYGSGITIIVTLLFVFGLGTTLIADIWYARTSATCINEQVRVGQWDLLRLTPLRDVRILIGVYAVAQVRAWRLVMVEIGIRIVPLVYFVLEFFLPARWLIPTLLGVKVDYWQYTVLNSFGYDVWGSLTIILLIVVAAGVYVLEPLWRMRAVVALGMAVSAHVQNESFATIVTVVGLLAMRLLQLVLMATITYALFVIFAELSTSIMRYYDPQFVFVQRFLVPMFMMIPFIGAIYAFYRFLAAGAYNYALSRAFISE